ncbi:hypothetical protein WAE56_06280 [Iodobacter sp. LRB]|uniref:hypothetical protein n=1 Tax=unclassified Iodobacter TaxID=235634 RepID=UPI000C0E97D3|nr:hypothetical protein [Iodobacter sp. BJB302]PHV03442.1 hypothetical protein CSQ88_01640 [Iodobacter sp. BJB302]
MIIAIICVFLLFNFIKTLIFLTLVLKGSFLAKREKAEAGRVNAFFRELGGDCLLFIPAEKLFYLFRRGIINQSL